MKTILLSLLVTFNLQFINAQQSTKIKDVTVYLDGAEINRSASIDLKSGTTEFTFNKLSPHIEESSIQVSGLKHASILSINYDINYLSKQKQSDSIKALQEELKALDKHIQLENHLIAGYNEEIGLIQSNKRLGNETEVVSLEQLKAFASYYRKRITELKTDINSSNTKIEDYESKQGDIKKQLAEFNVDEKVQTGEIKLKLNTDKPVSLELKISYNIKNAGWFPIYDLKADRINSPINLEYKAHVFQSSGCDWDNVNLVLSTADPNTNNEKPIVNPKYLNFINAYSNYRSQRATKSYNYKYNPLVKTVSGVVTSASDGLPLPGANIVIKGTARGTTTDFDGHYSLQTENGNALQYSYVGMEAEELPIHSSIMNVSLNEDLAQLDEVIVVGYGGKGKSKHIERSLQGQVAGVNISNQNGQPSINQYGTTVETGITNTRFKIDKAYSIPSDGDVTVIEIDRFDVPANYEYFAAPVLNENVFLTAKIGNWEQYNLLPAEANVYFEGSYSGKTNINPSATTDSLTISLGVDPNIVVKRTQRNDFKKTTFIGNNKVVYKAYDIEVRNNKQSDIQLTLLDRIPISQNKTIKLDDIETGNSSYDEDKGILKWLINLKSGEIEKVEHSYAVKYPKGKRVNL